MRLLKVLLFVLLGVCLGVLGHKVWIWDMYRNISIKGFLKLEPEQDPSISPLYPPGFYVESRVYLETASTDMVGKKVWAWGNLDSERYPDAGSFPKIKNKELHTEGRQR